MRVWAIISSVCAFVLSAFAAHGDDLTVWAVDPLIKVFRDAEPPTLTTPMSGPRPAAEARRASGARPSGRPATVALPKSAAGNPDCAADAARGEHADFQVAARSTLPVSGLKVSVAPLAHDSDPAASLAPSRVRFVGYVPVDRPMQHPPKDRLRAPPCDFPDPLLELDSIDLAPNMTQPVWITIPAPSNAVPGMYRGKAVISGKTAGGVVSAELPLSVHVYRAVVGPAELRTSNWFRMRWNHMKISPIPFSREYWDLLDRYAANMAEHRQNTVQVPLMELVQFEFDGAGEMSFDFSRVDAWLSTFERRGMVRLIEGEPFGRRGDGGKWDAQFEFEVRTQADGKTVAQWLPAGSPDVESFYSAFLPALAGHLRNTGRIARYAQHVADEPIPANASSYRQFAALMRKHAPDIRIIEACQAKELAEFIDVWVVILDMLHRDFDFFKARRAAGVEVWHYVCVWPQHEYANRFIELPLLKTRLLYWICGRYGLSGFLHWGYNYWTNDDPFTHTTPYNPGFQYLPAGDACIVYPGSDGPLDSIRHEASRDGMADAELLRMLAERKPADAARLAARHVRDFNDYDCDVESFRATRRELLTLLSTP